MAEESKLRLRLWLVVLLYTVTNLVFAVILIISYFFAWSAIALIAAPAIWSLIVFYYRNSAERIWSSRIKFGALSALLPAIVLWVHVFMFGFGDQHFLAKIATALTLILVIILPPTLFSILSGHLAVTLSTYKLQSV